MSNMGICMSNRPDWTSCCAESLLSFYCADIIFSSTTKGSGLKCDLTKATTVSSTWPQNPKQIFSCLLLLLLLLLGQPKVKKTTWIFLSSSCIFYVLNLQQMSAVSKGRDWVLFSGFSSVYGAFKTHQTGGSFLPRLFLLYLTPGASTLHFCLVSRKIANKTYKRLLQVATRPTLVLSFSFFPLFLCLFLSLFFLNTIIYTAASV